MTQSCCDPEIDTRIWESYKPYGQPYTYLRVARRKTVSEVYEALKAALGQDEHGHVNLPGVDEYLSLGSGYMIRPNCQTGATELSTIGDIEWPEGRIVVFSVNGSSEGDYVHVEVHAREGGRVISHLVFLGKSLMGRDAAWGGRAQDRRPARRLANPYAPTARRRGTCLAQRRA